MAASTTSVLRTVAAARAESIASASGQPRDAKKRGNATAEAPTTDLESRMTGTTWERFIVFSVLSELGVVLIKHDVPER